MAQHKPSASETNTNAVGVISMNLNFPHNSLSGDISTTTAGLAPGHSLGTISADLNFQPSNLTGNLFTNTTNLVSNLDPTVLWYSGVRDVLINNISIVNDKIARLVLGNTLLFSANGNVLDTKFIVTDITVDY